MNCLSAVLSFFIALYSTSCFAFPSSNFILVTTHAGPTFVEYKSSQTHFQYSPINSSQNIHKYDAKYERMFSFYPSSNGVSPSIVTKKDNMIFLSSDNNKLEPLGFFLPPESKDLSCMENSVAEGKLLLGFKNKAHVSVALIQDSSGMVYSVTRLSKQHYSIQSLGMLANNI